MMKRYALHFLALINIALALALAWMWVGADGMLRNTRWKVPPPHLTDFAGMLPALPGLVPADTSQFIAMLDRPLFSSSRRPPPPPPPPQAEAPQMDSLSAASVSGLFYGDGVGGIIISIGGKHRRAKLNEVIEGWTVKAIQDRTVTFVRGGEHRVLQLPRGALTMYSGLAPAPGQAPVNAAGGSAITKPSALGAPPGVGAPGGQASPGGVTPRPRATFGGRS